MKPFMIVFATCIVFGCSGFGYADTLEISDDLLFAIMDLEGGAAFLEVIVAQIEADQEEIDQLREQRDEARNEVFWLQTDVETLKEQLRRTKGLYAGGVIGYPLFTGMAVLEYRFGRWSPMLIGGYGGRGFIGMGVNIRVGQ